MKVCKYKLISEKTGERVVVYHVSDEQALEYITKKSKDDSWRIKLRVYPGRHTVVEMIERGKLKHIKELPTHFRCPMCKKDHKRLRDARDCHYKCRCSQNS